MILRRICQLSLTRITHQVSRAFDLNLRLKRSLPIFISVLSCRNNYDISVCAPSYNSKAHPRQSFHAKKGLDHWSSPVFLRVCATSYFFSNPNVFSIIKYTSQKMCYLVFISRQTVPKSGSKTARISSLFSKTNGSCSAFT